MAEKILGARFGKENSHLLSTYLDDGGYGSLKDLFLKKPDEVIEIVKASGLRGRGGAGFPTGLKWSFVPKTSVKPKYLCVNADEGEPGTFKDRYIMSDDPHLLLEGCIICCYAIGAHAAYIYIRGEFKEPIERLESAVKEAVKSGYLGKNIQNSGFDLEIYIHPGAGAYICGEETSLIESNEGKRGMPRLKPPFPAVVGLFGGPTVINNVETLACLPYIIKNGPERFVALGSEKNAGTKLFCVSGHVKQPGLYELPMGTPLSQIIYETCGGIKGDKALKGVIPGGSSCPVLLPNEIDVKMDFDSLAKIGSMLGSAGVIVMDENTCMVAVAARLAKFYAHESCGQCTPCREGVAWISSILHRIEAGKGKEGDIELLLDLCDNVQGHTICPLGDACAMPVRAFVQKFRKEFEQHIRAGACTEEPFPNPWDEKG